MRCRACEESWGKGESRNERTFVGFPKVSTATSSVGPSITLTDCHTFHCISVCVCVYVCVSVRCCVGVCVCVLLALSQTLCSQKPGGPIDLAIITRHGKWLLKVYFATARPLIRNDAFRTPSRNSKEMTKSLNNGQGGAAKWGNRKLSLSLVARVVGGSQQMQRERERERANSSDSCPE